MSGWAEKRVSEEFGVNHIPKSPAEANGEGSDILISD